MPTHYYVVHVSSPADPEAGIRGYERRFEFSSEEDAASCEQRAREAGLEARTERVLTFKTRPRLLVGARS